VLEARQGHSYFSLCIIYMRWYWRFGMGHMIWRASGLIACLKWKTFGTNAMNHFLSHFSELTHLTEL